MRYHEGHASDAPRSPRPGAPRDPAVASGPALSPCSRSPRARRPGAFGVLAGGHAGGPVSGPGAQEWDSARVLELVERARDRRQEPVLDETLRNYRAEVAGHIYFFVDSPGAGGPGPAAGGPGGAGPLLGVPGPVKQVIRGMRHEEQFPIRDFHYYLDRYTVIHDGFGDEIRVGEGRDVRNVTHPLAPGAEASTSTA
jgi:hypothetical protein